MLTPAQVRAARGFLGWSQTELATRADVALQSVKNFERGATGLRADTRAALVGTLVAAGANPVSFTGSAPSNPQSDPVPEAAQ